MTLLKSLSGITLSAALFSSAFAGEITINSDHSDPVPKKAMEELIADFQKANPDVKVKWNNFDHEGYKSAIRNFLTADAPDVVAWYAGNRMEPFVKAGLFEDVTDVWTADGLEDQLKSASPSMTIDGKKWGVPYTYYQWGIYYRKDIFAQQSITPPKTWAELVAASKKLKDAGITPFTIGTKALWPTAGWFDYLDLRVNGYDFHMQLTSGKVPYTDPRVKAVFEKWAELVKPGYFIENHAAIDWQDAAPQLVQGKAAMYLMGNFAVATFKNGGLKEEQIGFLPFPEITAGIPIAEEAPTDTFHIPKGAKNKDDAKKFLAYVASPDAQTKMNATMGQLPVNNKAEKPTDPFLEAGFDMLSKATAIAQFYDRDAQAEMAKAGMEGFQEFMVKPDKIDAILARLEKIRARVYK
ncbi:extracellular solute-binding protein [Agrobacterium rubi]|uniref:Extracellular solute-binding protein n=1 Tax=Agrobacterium rubi TaxID=28099 RepID=A0AAE7R9M5_9HYPH|nr:extracellular solute-binding protein [Agrobacterium rubi]NTE88955.1 extracellular solute-binding protein [Agrobacterium rubi]NTF04783.1 extracellular solute-binding protein [Agrobacterium rubi]NTF39344.1 extracellular solute-binding protein [Agrobacterium rubi]OCJ51172.1 sugar ABC transporter substrate-binding protein [Agrobacterium rubi]QTG02983.1 extracellular solute-binding protein [Agrobacterium rubi]